MVRDTVLPDKEDAMQEFQGRVAVITGAGSGIGRGLAHRCAQEGMKVVLADVNTAALVQTEAELKAAGAVVFSVPTDVSRAGDVEALAQKTLEAFGGVHLLFNNAGVVTLNPLWESSLAEWEWVLGVNLWGVIHGVHFFLPMMLKQDAGGHIVNTASMAGLIASPGIGIYRVSKHSVVALSETLCLELAQRGAKVKVSVLCPAFVNTELLDSSVHNRPAGLHSSSAQSPEAEATGERLRQAALSGMSPDQVAECVFTALRDDKFYILTHPEWKEKIRLRMEGILQEHSPIAATGR
jgi:NAD(P)-dependent dehydrogenase (short-subunit alcohol dehydrogenase family)